MTAPTFGVGAAPPKHSSPGRLLVSTWLIIFSGMPVSSWRIRRLLAEVRENRPQRIAGHLDEAAERLVQLED